MVQPRYRGSYKPVWWLTFSVRKKRWQQRKNIADRALGLEGQGAQEPEGVVRMTKCLYISAEWLQSLRRADSASVVGQGREHLLKAAREMLEEPRSGEKWDLFFARRCLKRLVIWGFAYQVTREQAFAHAVEELIDGLIRLDKWVEDQMLERKPPWHSALDTAELAFGVGLAYDWIRDTLDSQKQRRIEEGLWSLGIGPVLQDWVDPATRIHCLDSMGHNWWAVCIGGAGVALLACRILPQRDYWLQQICVALEDFVLYKGNDLWNKPLNFGTDGGFYESIIYCNYTLIYLFRFFEAWSSYYHRLPQVYDLPELKKTCCFYLDTFYETVEGIQTPDFGDHSLHWAAEPMVLARLASLYRDTGLQWYYQQLRSYPQDIFELVWYDPDLPGVRPPVRDLAVYEDIGWGIMRSKDRQMFVAIRSGDVWNHAHADCGALILFDRGRQFIADSGTCKYELPLYRSYYSTTRAHSTLLVNGQGEEDADLYYGLRFRGRLLHPCSGEYYQKLTAELTGPLARLVRRATRTLVLFDDVLVLVDDVLAYEPATYQLLWHTPAKFTRENNLITLENGGEKLYLAVYNPVPLTWTVERGYGADLAEREFLQVGTCAPNLNGHFFSFISRNAPEELGAEFCVLRDGLGLSFTTQGHRWQVLLNTTAGRRMHENSNVTWLLGEDTVETDAHLLVLKEDFYGVHQGSYLRKNGQVLFSSFTKMDCLLPKGKLPRHDQLRWQAFI